MSSSRLLSLLNETAQRRAVRRSLTDWARLCGYEPATHHQLILAEIEAFFDDPDLDLLMLHAPPGSAKSTYVSILLPPWWMARNPGANILAATHSAEFAMRWGRRVRGLIRDRGNQLGVMLDPSNSASDRWALTHGGEYYGVGAGVGISGFRADLALADDLFGNREDAWSDPIRVKRWDWWRDDFGNRLKPGAKRLMMNTRWHEEDVAGRVLEQVAKDDVRAKVIDIRAIAEPGDVLGRKPGELLWANDPSYDYPSYLRQRQRELSPMMWAALFQQRPAPEEGAFFKREWFRKPTRPRPPLTRMKLFGASDYAMTAGGGDYTTHLVGAIDEDDDMWLVEVWRDQTKPETWVESLLDLMQKYRPLAWAEENVQITSGIGPYIDSRQRQRKIYCAREQFPTRGDKAMRASSIRGRIALRGIYVDESAPWFGAFIHELLGFPAGKHDDQVDAFGLFGQLLDLMLPPPKPEAPKPKPRQRDWFEAKPEPDVPSWKIQ